MENQNSYFSKLLKSGKTVKKQVALYLDEAKIERIDMIVKQFSTISDARSFSRNTLIEEAIDKFLEESEKFLLEEHGLDIDMLLEEERSKKYDTVIFSSTGRGFEDVFLGESEHACWYPCKISDIREPDLEYIAIYRGTPVSAITHYARIKEFKKERRRGENGEYEEYKVCYFEGKAVELPHKITLGNKPSIFFRGGGGKYTFLESLLNAKKADEIVFDKS
ncbi:MAG: hypothetical protein HFI51_13020 [Lachnospiraceae bacterium]|nr:hypothetical protein [Lachnospiraceae bacterium]